MGWKRRKMPVAFAGHDAWFSYCGETGSYASEVGEELFHSSWDWLMPVINKIEYLDKDKHEEGMYSYLVTINRIHTYIERIQDSGGFKMPFVQMSVGMEGKDKLECTYKAVVKFIEWHNKQNK